MFLVFVNNDSRLRFLFAAPQWLPLTLHYDTLAVNVRQGVDVDLVTPAHGMQVTDTPFCRLNGSADALLTQNKQVTGKASISYFSERR